MVWGYIGIAVFTVGVNVYGYFREKDRLGQIARKEDMGSAIESIQRSRKYERKDLVLRATRPVYGIGDMLARNGFLAGLAEKHLVGFRKNM